MLKQNVTQPLALILAGATAFISFNTIFWTKSKIASAQKSGGGELYVPSIESNGALLPDWERITFRLIPPISGSGSLELSGLEGVLGYDASRSWNAGDSITSIVMLGDLTDVTNLPTRSLWSILNPVGLSGNSLSLADFGLIKKQTLKTLVDAIPDLANFSLYEVAPLYDLLQTRLGSENAWALRNWELEDLINNEQLANLSLDSIDLAKYELNSLPGLLNTPLARFAVWGETLIGEIPGLADLPFANFFTDLGTPGIFALVDIVFGEKEAYRVNTVTGSDVVGFDYPCDQNNCAHIELAGPDWLGATFFHGKQWISGQSQWVAGGSGCLAGSEPTGRLPFGEGFKVVLTDTDEASGLAEFSIYFRFCTLCGCSPYIIGPFPWMSQHEKDIIFLGAF
ncbi:conserved hypothetical protein [Gloeothece citriformis PCC 7424]|uniref:Uncharacterized protein n=1 Tax=Gloeothece citriformis (strain PCC 7424) TaxID=65393 RepID=B7KJZ9_GLOC7|nr:hypothetical protein [Gloeothece citriformis]ACK70884.1 conserved hypothetical protein [Gloeothece citriformis PCC 7424]